MIQVTPQISILVAVEAVEFFTGLLVWPGRLQSDPFSGALFVYWVKYTRASERSSRPLPNSLC
jgi:hypothetical protein